MGLDSPVTGSPAPPKGMSTEDELAWYKTQYEQVELELRDFQESSKELEAELEKDIEASEKRERLLKEKAEKLGFEVDEWKEKHRKAKAEANSAQNTLQKEVTTLRDANRTLMLKLRDIEVANDDFEKQARHQTSSLEDVESKYNVAIERGVMLEEEIKNGEKEREDLRVEAQRLRDELSDLKVEAEITQEKLQLAQSTLEAFRSRKPSNLETAARPPSQGSEVSTSATTISSPTITTPPPTKSGNSSSAQTTPPSPPLSETSAVSKAFPVTPANKRILEPGTTPRPLHSGIRPPRHSRGPSMPAASAIRQQGPTTAAAKRTTTRPSISSRPSVSGRPSISSLPAPVERGSLYQARNLRNRVQTLTERVASARSKLPGPTTTPPRASPRSANDASLLSNVTVRSSRKRSSAASTATGSNADGPASRLSFGFNPSASVGAGDSRPSSRASMYSANGANGVPRPSSRASGIVRPPSQASARPGSALGYNYNPAAERRPRSSISGSYAAVHGSTTPSLARSEIGSRSGTPGPRLGHSYSNSVVNSRTEAALDEEGGFTPTARRTTLDKGFSGIPNPAGLSRRQSSGVGGLAGQGARRQSNIGTDGGGGGMPPPTSTAKRERKNVDIGETF